jgi:hypothetical protein
MPDSPVPSSEPRPTAQITIRRDSTDDIQLRQIVIKLDGQRITELMYGDSITFPVAAGRHQLRVDNTWNRKTLELDLAPGQHLKFLTVNRAGRFTWFLVGTLGAGPMYVSIEPEPAAP